jgi:leucyl-tRNA synthetase
MDPRKFEIGTEAYLEKEGTDAVMINSDFLDGMTVPEAKEEIARRMEQAGIGERRCELSAARLGVSRQRYWGCPIRSSIVKSAASCRYRRQTYRSPCPRM